MNFVGQSSRQCAEDADQGPQSERSVEENQQWSVYSKIRYGTYIRWRGRATTEGLWDEPQQSGTTARRPTETEVGALTRERMKSHRQN